MKLAVHDLMIRDRNQSNSEVFSVTERLVRFLDKIGYNRYWFAEHHGMESLLSSSPETMISYFASKTENIRLGSGGTMIMHYSPYKIAEVFKTLSYLAPGRVDLGLGRAPGSSFNEIMALGQGTYNNQDLYKKIEVILDYLKDKTPDDSIYSKASAIPKANDFLVSPWMLGSTGASSMYAAKMGLGYSFAKFFSMETPLEVFKAYKDNFVPSEFFQRPELSVSYKILVCENKEELEYLGKSFDYGHVKQTTELFKGLPSPEEVKDYDFSSFELDKLNHDYNKRFIIKGTKEEVSKILEEEIDSMNVDELLVFSPIFGIENRMKSYRLLKEIFDL